MYISLEIKIYAYVTSIVKLFFSIVTIKIDVLVPLVYEHINTATCVFQSINLGTKEKTLFDIPTFHG